MAKIVQYSNWGIKVTATGTERQVMAKGMEQSVTADLWAKLKNPSKSTLIYDTVHKPELEELDWSGRVIHIAPHLSYHT